MARSEAKRALAVVALGGLAWACTCASPPGDAGVDAADAGALDTGSDAPDVLRDTPRDVPEVVVPGFVRVGEGVLPRDCDLRMATDPTTTHGGPLTFVPCPGRSGCRQVDVDWTSFDYPTFEIGRFESEHDGTHGHFAYARLAPDSTADFVDWQVIANDAGDVEVILRSPRLLCDASWFAIQDGRYATFVYYRDVHANRLGEYVVGGELSDPLGTFTVLAFLDPTTVPVPVQTIAVDRTGVAVELSGGSTVWRIDWDGAMRRVASPITDGGAASGLDFVRDDAVVVSARGSLGTEVRAIVADGTPASLVPYSPDGAPLLAATDGVDLAWTNGVRPLDSVRFERVELWTSPYCTSAACLAPRFVVAMADVSSHPPLRVGHGLAAHFVTLSRMRFVDLSDGSTRDLDLPDGRTWFGLPPYIGPEEVAIAPKIDRFPSSPIEAETLMFIRRDAL